MSFSEFVQAVARNVSTVGFPYPGRSCHIWISERNHIAELWYDGTNQRAELQLHKMGDQMLLVAAYPLSGSGVKDVAFSIDDYFQKV